MSERGNHDSDFKARMALEAVKEVVLDFRPVFRLAKR